MSSKVILIRLPFDSIYSVYGKLPKNHELRPPLGLMYLASSLEADGHEVEIIDGAIRGFGDIASRAFGADFVGISATTPEIGLAREVAGSLKVFCKKTVTILGGPHATALGEEIDAPEFDYIVVGEGEQALCSIISGKPTNRVIQKPDIEDLDSLPLPARHLVDYQHYRYPMPGKGLVRTDVVQSIRGCPYRCTFCSVGGTKPRFRSPEAVVDEIEKSYRDHNIKFMMFLDDTLTVRRSHIIAICHHIIKRGLNKKLGFWGLVRADTVDRTLLRMMAQAGFKELSMGVETGAQTLASMVRKGTTLRQVEQAYSWMKELGVQTRGSFIIGLPNESHFSARWTIDFAKDLDLDRASCNILTPYPGTKIYEQAKNGEGLRLLTDNWSEYKRWGNSVIETNDLSKEDLEGYQRQFLAEFYSQPKVIRYHLKQFAKGNHSSYYYRPVIFALREKLRKVA